MSELSMMVTITERSKLTTFLSFYRERQVPVQFISLALGTASNETLNYLGLERSDKCVFASFVTDEKWEELRRGLRRFVRDPAGIPCGKAGSDPGHPPQPINSPEESDHKNRTAKTAGRGSVKRE